MTLSKLVPKKAVFIAGTILLITLAIALRATLGQFGSDYDLQVFLLPWYDHIKTFGLHGFKDNFANYNLPYLYLLLVAAKLGLPALVGIKVTSIIFDFILAYAIFLVVRHFKPSGYIPYIAGIATLFLPVPLLNGSFWGQCDSIYTSFLVFSFWAVLKKRPLLVWIFWGIAFAFKLQAIFFLPLLLFVWFALPHAKKQHILLPFVSLVAYFIPFIPALLAGRSFTSILSIYSEQATGGAKLLTLNAANAYQWIPPADNFDILKTAGIITTGAVLLVIFILALTRLRQRRHDADLLILATLFLWLVPFFLPMMHERYFFPAEIFTFIVAAVVGGRYIVVAIFAQIGTCFAYAPFLFNETPVALGVIAGVELVFIALLFYDAFIKRELSARTLLRN